MESTEISFPVRIRSKLRSNGATHIRKTCYHWGVRTFPDLTGRVFFRLTVIEFAGYRGKYKSRAWRCQCSCGNIVERLTRELLSDRAKSCGCWRRDRDSPSFAHGFARRGEKSPTYCVWISLRERCNNPNCRQFKDYGGRGITCDQRWDDYPAFLAD